MATHIDKNDKHQKKKIELDTTDEVAELLCYNKSRK